MKKYLIFAALLLTGILPGICVRPSEGHGYIVRSIPADRSVVTRAPGTVQVWFSEGLEPAFSTIEVFNQQGEQIDSGNGGVDEQNSAKLIVSLPSDLPQGAYLVRMRPVFTSDGHAVNDTLVFWIGERVGTFKESGSSSTAVPLEVVWRILLTLSLTILFGTILSYALVLRPAWGNPGWKFGHLPPRIMRRLSIAIWSSLLIAIFVNGLALIQITMTLFDTRNVFEGNLLNLVLQGTNFGSVWQIRMMLLVAMLSIQIIAAQQSRNRPGSTHILWLVNGGLALLTLGSLSLISHASGSQIWPFISVTMDFIHLSAVATWIGGLVVIALILRPALQPLSPVQRGQALFALLRRFSALALVGVSVIVTTGLYAASINIPEVNDVADTTYGLTLLAKLILILPLLTLGAIHFAAISPERIEQFAEKIKFQQRFAQLPQTLHVEVLFAIVVMLAAATLPATPPPQPSDARGQVEATSETVTVEGYEVSILINPGAVGANLYDVNIRQNGEAANVESVKIRFSYPERGLYTAPLTLETAESGLWVGAGGDIIRAGEWDVLVDIDPGAGPPIRAALTWDIKSSVEAGRSPGIFNWLSLLVVIGVLAGWILPPAYQYGKSLDWTPQTVTIAVISVILTAGVVTGGAFFFNANSRRIEDQRNPPPGMVNPVFADLNSLLQGQEFYENDCLVCHGSDGRGSRPAALNSGRLIQPFTMALSGVQDEDLYRLLSQGIAGRHRYGVELMPQERWQLINFIRQLE